MKRLRPLQRVLPLLLALACQVTPLDATPPRPPATLDAYEASKLQSFTLEGDHLPFRILVHEEGVQNLSISARLVPMDASGRQIAGRQAVSLFAQTYEAIPGKEMAFKLPLGEALKVEGRIEVKLMGRLKGGGGFSNRFTAYVTQDPSGKRVLLRPSAWQARRDEAKQRRFDELRKQDERLMPIRELFDDTAKVPTGVKRSAVVYPIPAGRRIEVRPAELTPFLKKHSVDSTKTSYTSQDPITVRGRFLFQDIDGVFKPLVNAAIHLWDSDTFGDEHLGSVATGWDGRWSFTVNNDDGWLQDGRDLYYTIKLDTTRLSLSTCNFLAGAYEWKSAVHNDMSDGVVLDFGDETASTNTDALPVWSTLNLAWNHASTAGGFDPGKIDGCFPGSGTFWNGKVNIAADDVNGPDSITHEYGHGVMDRAYAASGGDPSPGGPHGFGDCGQNQALSWSEGWATAFMLTLRQDGAYNWDEGDGGRAIEAFSSTCRTGNSSEGWVAAALLDMFDSANDDNGGNEDRGRNGASDANAANRVSLATMLRDTMVGTRHNNVIEFWNDLTGEISGATRTSAQTIMNYDWMPVSLPSSCAATKVATAELPQPESVLGGLRKFRDHALKTWPTGRALANAYYRSSPEIALLLLKNPSLRGDALKVMKHFAALGETITRHERYVPWARTNPLMVDPGVADAAARLLEAMEAQGSDDLKKTAALARKELEAARSMRLADFEQRAAEEKKAMKASGGTLAPLNPRALSPASQEALKDKGLRDSIEKSLRR